MGPVPLFSKDISSLTPLENGPATISSLSILCSSPSTGLQCFILFELAFRDLLFTSASPSVPLSRRELFNYLAVFFCETKPHF